MLLGELYSLNSNHGNGVENDVDSWPSGLGSRATAVTSRVQTPARTCADEVPKMLKLFQPNI